ncbi:MAG: polysaccharide deacetylase family protein [Lawsonibacter sp.]
MRKNGLQGVGLALLTACFTFALGSGPGTEISPALGGAKVEVQTDLPPLVALTFDDGPRNATTSRLLEGLALREVPATFFLVGYRIAGSEDLIREMAREGSQIGIHTYDHVLITDLSQTECDLQVDKTRALLTDILGPGDYWLRPPFGLVNQKVTQWADGPLILWSVDPEDWKRKNADQIVSVVMKNVKDGDIILMHDIYDSSVDAALCIVDQLLEQGYCFVTVEQLMQLRGVTPEPGGLYMELPPG